MPIKMPKIAVGIDVGGTKIALGAYDPENPTHALARIEHRVTGNFERDFKHIVDFIQSLTGRLTGIGIAVPGILNKARSELINAANLPYWVGKRIVDRLAYEFGVPVALGNDLEAQAFGEAHYGHGQRQNFLQIGWGTGVGSKFALHLGGEILLIDSEVGHTQVNSASNCLCPCGQLDCLEYYAGGAGIKKCFKTEAKDLDDSYWPEIVGWMALGIKNALTVLPVDLVVFSGGIATGKPHLLSDLEQRLHATMKVFDGPAVKLSALGGGSGTIGAAALLHRP